jgi:beta-lactamase class A
VRPEAIQVHRRTLLAAGGALALAAAPALAAANPFAALEAKVKGRLGVAVLTGAGDLRLAHRADERFAMCSTFNALLAARVLARADRGEEDLDREIAFTRADMLSHAPVTEPALGKGRLTVGELCEAIVTVSDNPAANLLLATIGGPAGLTAWLRGIGDPVTRLDRRELALNTAIPGDPRDTTTPQQMARTLRLLATGQALTPASRAKLVGWMVASPTGTARLRKHAPAGWRIGDKTGTGSNGSTNDIAVITQPDGGTIFVASYLTETKAPLAEREAVHAEVGKIVFETFRGAA